LKDLIKMTTAITAPAVGTTIESLSHLAAQPGGSYFTFLNVENLHHRLQTAVQIRIDAIQAEELRTGSVPRDIYIASRGQICGDPEAAGHLIDALRQLIDPLLLLLNEKFNSVEVIDLHQCGHLDRLRSSGKHTR
jgi:hypothetical protein